MLYIDCRINSFTTKNVTHLNIIMQRLMFATFAFWTIVSAKVPKIFSEVKGNTDLSWVLDPKPNGEGIITVLNQKNNTIFAFLNEQSTVHPSYQDRIHVHLSENHSMINFTLLQILKADAGLYYANYDSFQRPGILLIVLEPPDKPIIEEISLPLLYESLLLHCSSNSNSLPPMHGVEMKFHWFINDRNISTEKRYSFDKSSFSINPVLKEDDGIMVFCTVSENKSHSLRSTPYKTNVLYGPHEIVLTPKDTVYRFEAGESAPNINCNADCSPMCSIAWYTQTRRITTEETLTLGSMSDNISDIYYCSATNSFGKIQSRNVVIEVLNLTVHTKGEYKCKYGSKVQLSCAVDDSIVFVRFLPWIHKRNSSILRQIPGTLNGKVNKLVIQSCKNKDAGDYICNVDMSYYKKNEIRRAETKLKVTDSRETTNPSVGWALYVIGGSVAAGGLFFAVAMVLFYRHRRKQKQISAVLSRLRLRMENGKQRDVRNESESIDNDPEYNYISENERATSIRNSSDETLQENDNTPRQSDESYDDVVDIVSAIESINTSKSSYEELNDANMSSSYTKLGDEQRKPGDNEYLFAASITVSSDDNSNLADDENSTSNSDELRIINTRILADDGDII